MTNPIPVPGSYNTFFPKSFKEIISFLTKTENYTESQLKKVKGATVFKAHPGLPTIVLCNNISAEFFFKAPDDLLEREDIQRFGPVAPRQELLKQSDTAILSSGEIHHQSRGLIDGVISQRRDLIMPLFEKNCIEGIKQWPEQSSIPIEEGFQRLTIPFAFQWLLGVTPNIDDVLAWQKYIVVPKTDSTLTNFILNRLSKLPKEVVTSSERLTELVRSAPLFSEYMEQAKKQGFNNEDNVARQLIFVCAFNMSAGISRFLLPSMVAISLNTEARTKLVAELDAWDPEKTKLNDLPYLDAMLDECMRLYPWPRFVHRKAHRDFILPAENGLQYQIHKGDLLMTNMPYVHRDPTVFKNDPLIFRPERFIDDPSLKEKIFTFGWANEQAGTYGCAGRGYAKHLWKLLVSQLCKHYTWQVRGANLSLNNTLDVAPEDTALEDFKLR